MTNQEDDDKTESGTDPSGIIRGALNIFGVKIDLGQLLSAPLDLAGQLDDLREKLKQAGGGAVLSDDEWIQGGASVTGHIRTRGILGDQEFHIGTMGHGAGRVGGREAAAGPEEVEPPTDVFDGEDEVTIVADVPGVILDDLEVKVEGRAFSLTTRAGARRNYRKELLLESAPDPNSLRTTCHNGVMEARLRKQGSV